MGKDAIFFTWLLIVAALGMLLAGAALGAL